METKVIVNGNGSVAVMDLVVSAGNSVNQSPAVVLPPARDGPRWDARMEEKPVGFRLFVVAGLRDPADKGLLRTKGNRRRKRGRKMRSSYQIMEREAELEIRAMDAEADPHVAGREPRIAPGRGAAAAWEALVVGGGGSAEEP